MQLKLFILIVIIILAIILAKNTNEGFSDDMPVGVFITLMICGGVILTVLIAFYVDRFVKPLEYLW